MSSLQATILDVAMRPLDPQRRKVIAAARGEVLEIGVGTGLNLPLYQGVTRLVGVEPDPDLLARARERAAERSDMVVELVQGVGEALPVPDASVDCVVCTWVLCTAPDPRAVLAEIRRVLRPGGRYLFAEHVVSETACVAAGQHLLNPAWRCVASGCNLDRDTLALVRDAGFRAVHLRPPRGRAWLPIPSWRGEATR